MDGTSYSERGWCRLEQMAFVLTQGLRNAYLYDTADGTQALHQFEHPKAVWCVRLSPSVTMMAVAGYDVASHPLAP